MRSLRISAAVTLTIVALGGCTRDQQVATAPPSSTDAPVTTPVSSAAPTTVAATTTAPSTAAPTTAAATTIAPTTAAPTTVPATTAVPVTTAAPTPTGEIVTVQYGLSPIGVWDGSTWRLQEWGADHLPTFTATIPDVVVTGLSLATPITGATFGPVEYHCVTDDQAPSVVLPAGATRGDGGSVAVSANWNVQPRPVTQVGLDAPEYQALGESLVDRAQGADPAAGDVVQVVRADLDGNGVEEVLVTFAHQTDDGGFGAAGDYTLIIARYPRADGSVDDTVLWSFYEQEPVDFPNPGTGDVLAVADLNGDGVMEVVTSHTYWEAGLADIYALVGGRLEVVAGGGCGV